MKASIYLRIFLTHLLIIIVPAALILGLSYRSIQKHQTDMQVTALTRVAIGMKGAFEEALAGGTTRVDSLAKDLGNETGVRISVVSDRGTVLAESEADQLGMESDRTLPEIMRALRGGTGVSRRLSRTIGEGYLYVAVPLRAGGRVAAALRVGLPVKYINSSVAELRTILIVLTSSLVVLALVAALMSSRAISGPLDRLSRAVKKMAAGDFGTRVLLKSGGEIKDLANDFNDMAEHFGTLFKELYRTGDELGSIVAAMQDGLVVLDEDGRVLLTNASFVEIVGVEAPEGKLYWEVLRLPGLGDLVTSVLEAKSNRTCEISFGGRVFLCSGDYLVSRGGVVVIMHEITELRNVGKLKKDFVLNLSHELRTPLTAIKGFLETLDEEVTDEGRRYLGILMRHTERLAHIVDDLLLLSELEDRQTRLELENLDLVELVGNVIRIFERPTAEKNLKIEVDLEGHPPVIRGDRFKLEQVFINLIANAVKYTETGVVKIMLRTEDSDAVIEVEDTGIGIPEEHQSRVFERFYVVDKSRSRRLGGTGLGLSIVKHIVLLHNGSIEVESVPGRGSKFRVRLPQSPE
jgi:two-component system phosphate regulon sensor histidine kinase PhoR